MLSFGGTFLLQTAFAQVFDSVLLRINSKADRTVKLPEFSLIHTTLSFFSERKISKLMMLSTISDGSWPITGFKFQFPLLSSNSTILGKQRGYAVAY